MDGILSEGLVGLLMGLEDRVGVPGLELGRTKDGCRNPFTRRSLDFLAGTGGGTGGFLG